ncbi:hypothetical protein IHE44_0001447 [Lamprotornis superbus]|uniref:Shootin-1 n=1 Tax=Lamprotornis superbus TaxID=245042 RepID=A0A835TSQ1_9PASS|nr:hypothetical protein IHE44_0001447 [Lamprotornis superbus]
MRLMIQSSLFMEPVKGAVEAIGEYEELRAENKKTKEEHSSSKRKVLRKLQLGAGIALQRPKPRDPDCAEKCRSYEENSQLAVVQMELSLQIALEGPRERFVPVASILCDKIKQERDEAVKKLEEFQKISHMVIEEVNCIQNHLEIEKTCRESAEALASKLNKENKTLKRISMLCMAKLGPEIITEEINIDEDESSTDTEATSGSCNSVHCQQQIKVSVLAVEEYEELHENFELEKNLRKKAESFAQEFLSSLGGADLIKELEEQLENQSLHKEISRLKQQLELLEEDKKELELKCQHAEEKARDLKHSVDELQKRIQQSENPAPPPPPPPPPPLPPPPPPNPIRSLMSMIRKRSHSNTNVSKKEKPPQQESGEEVTDLKRQAVEEMMDRIKKGVHLRPVNQSSRPKTKPETPKPSESAMKELKGILGQGISLKPDINPLMCSPTGILATSESKSLPVLGSGVSAPQAALNKKDVETEFSSKVPNSGPVPNQPKGATGSKPILQSTSHTELTRKASSSEKETESVVVLDPVSTSGDQMSENTLNQNKLCDSFSLPVPSSSSCFAPPS